MDPSQWIKFLICLFMATTLPDVDSQTRSEPAPVFTFRPQNKSVNISARVIFSCTARGTPLPRISWVKYADNGTATEIRHDGRFFVSSISGHLGIPRVQWADEGRYGCTAQNEHGKVVADAFLTIITYGTPIWHMKPQNVTLYKSQYYRLPCKAYAYPSASYKWTKNGNQISDSGIKIGLYHLTFISASNRHTGWYKCLASNEYGSIWQSVYVKVVSDPSIVIQPESVSALRGDSVALSCGIVGTLLNFTWIKDNKILRDDDTWITFTRQTWQNIQIFSLNIKKVRSRYLGKYHCRVTNLQGSVSSKTAMVSYPDMGERKSLPPPVVGASAPEVKPANQVQVAEKDSNVSLKFAVVSFMLSNVSWYKNGKQMHDANFTVNYSNGTFYFVLAIPSVQYIDSAFYTCFVENPYGVSSGNVTLIVKGIPDAPMNITVEHISPGIVLISWIAGFNGGAACHFNVDFKRSGARIWTSAVTGINTTSVDLKNSQGWDGVYLFRVTAVNRFGVSEYGTVSVELKGNKSRQEERNIETSTTNAKIIIGGAIGGFSFVALILILVLVLLRRHHKLPSNQVPSVSYDVVDTGNSEANDNTYEDPTITFKDTTGKPKEVSDGYSYITLGIDAAAAMATGHGEYASVQQLRRWEVPKGNVRLDQTLGSGHFGLVVKGFLKSEQATQVVAVKMLKENADKEQKKEFLDELELMKTMVPHPNIVGLIACCTKSDKPFIIVEYCSLGNLRDYLLSSRGNVIYANLAANSLTLTCSDLLSFAWQCARGMSYLANHKLVHRDLAARNVLMGDGQVCKISDFGLARDVYRTKQYLKMGKATLPLRWMAIESIFEGITTTKSDVWSFGVLLWEIVTLGAIPYPAMSKEEVIEQLRIGYRMTKPSFCSDELYAIMWQCWQTDPESRPTFLELGKTLHRLKTAQKLAINLGDYDRSYINATEADQ
ncbi:platelet-derived growth factor receptor beta-like isoform X1 [Acropora millepora]|uniref:platelet-derived growth factor receptor beta-like isoform X1 n=1 Tax=Acropora millepora TaxID=45264 RepID=UPI001CF41693|nr:platelet-derived growth factor receptor beta-like isoform X1 [Acropora millepora]XP_029201847.2 platelet-derived growth factor receptor beta-like isoform X1 [Acropora millepora]XP_044180201.1 platelet-derived growth factor receptor beta-like isoform X1 [Acropora millepora]